MPASRLAAEAGVPLLDEDIEDQIDIHSHPSKSNSSLTSLKHITLGTASSVPLALLPSFIQRRLTRQQHPPRKLYPTSYLDGLRGVAAFIVFLCHFTENNVHWYKPLYGVDEDDGVASSPLQLPFVRVIYSGRPMVHIFFIISGYVLSCKSIKLLRNRSFTPLIETLSSTVFLRGMRLFLPTTISTFLVMLGIRLGWVEASRQTLAGNYHDNTALLEPSFTAQVWDWFYNCVHFTFTRYDVHLWTIPIEFKQSMVVFLVVLGLCRARVVARLSVLGIGMLYALFVCGRSASWDFLAGVVLAEYALLKESNQSSRTTKERNESSRSAGDDEASSQDTMLKTGLWLLPFLFGLFLAGWPNYGACRTPFYSIIQKYTAPKFLPDDFDPSTSDPESAGEFWQTISGLLIVATISQLHFLQDIFTTRFAQYLGDLSYGLYLAHGPVLQVFEPILIPRLYEWCGTESMSGRLGVWITGAIFMTTFTIWYADLIWRFVDSPSVKAAKRLEEYCCPKEDDGPIL